MNKQQWDEFVACVQREMNTVSETAARLYKEWEQHCGQGGEQMDSADEAAREENCQRISRYLRRANERFVALDERMAEIKKGGFEGLCGDCGEPIGHARLCAESTARFCISCEEVRDKGKKFFWQPQAYAN